MKARHIIALVLLAIVIAISAPVAAWLGYSVWRLTSARRACQWALANPPAAGAGSVTTPAFGPLSPCQAWILSADPADPIVVLRVANYPLGGWYGYVYHTRPLRPPLLVSPFGNGERGVYVSGEFVSVSESWVRSISYGATQE